MNSSIFHLPFTPLEEKDQENQGQPIESLGLPQSYGKNRLVALPRDPEWIWLYWELNPKKDGLTIRLYNARSGQAVAEVPAGGWPNYYMRAPVSGESYYAEIGVGSGKFFSPLLKSNIVTVPFGYPADKRPDGMWELRTAGSITSISSMNSVSSRASRQREPQTGGKS